MMLSTELVGEDMNVAIRKGKMKREARIDRKESGLVESSAHNKIGCNLQKTEPEDAVITGEACREFST